jgi:radical SAM protein with 4Fe4S-binding SPASM domain
MLNNGHLKRLDINKNTFWQGSRPFPVRLDMELTERCNNDCVHCYINLPAGDKKAKSRELSTDQIKRIIKEAVSLGCMVVRFTGGEPLLRKDFRQIYLFAREQGLRVMLFTNATLITKELAMLFKRVPPLEKMEVSVFGLKKASYESSTRQPGSFARAMAGVRLLLENKIPFVVKGALLPANKSEFKAFKAWSAKILGKDSPAPVAIFFDLRCRRDKKSALIRKIRATPQEGLKIIAENKEAFVGDTKSLYANFRHLTGNKLFSCAAGHAAGCVDAYGVFQPCMMLRHPDTVYDLKNGSLKDVLTNFLPKVGRMKARNPDYLLRCGKCFIRVLCEQCPAKSWMEHGTLDTPVEYLCEVAHAQGRFLGLVGRNEKAWQVKDWKKRVNRFIKNK